ncbi:hypothetical protein [Haliangium ochraceum]|uniref:hypothetical protein n=1 Tax=Haliangium ochraceum TaxID=80816 RepID=UPI0003038D9A|nr:hypothetical protein [Haliangium ochraceum]
MRSIHLAPAVADALARLVAARGAASDGPLRVPLQELEALESECGLRLPDAAIAYLAAGISVWGDGPVNLAAARERTRDLAQRLDDAGASRGDGFVAIDDDSNGNYLAVVAPAPAASSRLRFLDHEEQYALDGAEQELVEAIEQYLDHLADGRAAADAPGRSASGEDVAVTPFALELVTAPAPAAEPAAVWVEHASFGRGKVLAEAGDVVTVRFETAGEKRLKRSFLRFEE